MQPRSNHNLLILGMMFLFISCKKEIHLNARSTDGAVQQAKAYFERQLSNDRIAPTRENFRANQPRSVLWARARIARISNKDVVVVPVHYTKNLYISSDLSGSNLFSLSDVTNLVVWRTQSSTFGYSLVTYLPDSQAINSKTFTTGIAIVEDWHGNTLQKAISLKSSTPNDQARGKEVTMYHTYEVCVTIDGYNYSPAYPDEGYEWSETTCTMYGIDDGSAGTNTGPGADIGGIIGSSVASTITVSNITIAPPKNVIKNASDYFKCFTTGDAGHTFKVTLAVEQPVQGSRAPWTVTSGGIGGSKTAGNAFNVGHVWLIFTETTPLGTTTRNVGFYPTGMVSPMTPSSQGTLNNDEGMAYNIALAVSVKSDQFYKMLSYVSQGNNPGYMYDLNSNNCTSFALDAMATGNVAIPATIGTWAGNGKGLDPGDLGEDIRNMPLGSGMTRSTVSNFHPNIGNCNIAE